MADTGRLATGEIVSETEVGDHPHMGMATLTGNLYSATPAEDTMNTNSLATGFPPERYLSPLNWMNAEPA